MNSNATHGNCIAGKVLKGHYHRCVNYCQVFLQEPFWAKQLESVLIKGHIIIYSSADNRQNTACALHKRNIQRLIWKKRKIYVSSVMAKNVIMVCRLDVIQRHDSARYPLNVIQCQCQVPGAGQRLKVSKAGTCDRQSLAQTLFGLSVGSHTIHCRNTCMLLLLFAIQQKQ